jgi:hypothetical protein
MRFNPAVITDDRIVIAPVERIAFAIWKTPSPTLAA